MFVRPSLDLTSHCEHAEHDSCLSIPLASARGACDAFIRSAHCYDGEAIDRRSFLGSCHHACLKYLSDAHVQPYRIDLVPFMFKPTRIDAVSRSMANSRARAWVGKGWDGVLFRSCCEMSGGKLASARWRGVSKITAERCDFLEKRRLNSTNFRLTTLRKLQIFAGNHSCLLDLWRLEISMTMLKYKILL